jgi:hypothetical protein
MRMLRSGVTLRTAPRMPHAFITLYDTYMKLLFAGATYAGQSRVREAILVTLKRPKWGRYNMFFTML